ncbi:uncharacterized protein OCT59_011665 [Rhizophagus irregularis]|uniref:uncharacterized protein n=1 Tax=Rhizophagus irregularis TaxID=588596 RepID=UPI0033201664|nr:hypothetical protein OCT59_011665 [Rhizophagus irregularis]
MQYSRIARTLPTRPDIKELQYSGTRFSRGAIARLRNQPASLFSLLDHYDEVQLPDDADSDYFERFIIYVRHAPPVAGGCNGELNDCLYECLKHIYGIFSKIPETIKKPEYIKKALGLNRDAPVPVSYMDKIEQLAGSLALNIVGDSTQISKSKSDRRATLILSEGHYSLALNPGRLHPSKLDRKQKSPFVYREDGVNNVVTIYNGKTVKSLTVGQFQKGKNSDSYSFIPIEKNRKTGIYETLEETYQRIHEERDSFLQATKKFSLGIDLSYHNWSYKRTALWLFERFSVSVPANDPLDPVEAEWISDAMMGGLIWADNEWKGYGRQYNVTSLYPSIQQSNANFPIQQGKFQILKDFVDHRGYALYELFRAKLIQDGKPNALIYDREARIPGTVIFGSPFKGEYPRIAPFLLAHGRKMTSELLEPYKDKVRRIHTDGFILEEQPSSPTLITCPENASKALKALKFETAGYCHVKNANKFTIVSDETVLKIIHALKDTIVVTLVSGFSKTSYLVQDHVKYIKRIQTAKSPVSYVKFVARKLFPDNAAYTAKIAKIRESYKNKQALLNKLEALFELYYNVTKDSLTGPPKQAVTMNEAEKTLAELLA